MIGEGTHRASRDRQEKKGLEGEFQKSEEGWGTPEGREEQGHSGEGEAEHYFRVMRRQQ
jgi:hypothetical protein